MMRNIIVGYLCSAVVYRPAQKDWVVSLQHQQGAPFNLICSKGQAARFKVGRRYDFTLHPENFTPQARLAIREGNVKSNLKEPPTTERQPPPRSQTAPPATPSEAAT